MTETTRAFCVFEGGGAKGVAHLGALKAIQQDQALNICGYAGTSAGAVVAALAAAGWKPDELLSVDSDGNGRSVALEEVDVPDVKTLADFFGEDWPNLRKIRKIYRGVYRRRSWYRSVLQRASLVIFIVVFFPLIYLIYRGAAQSLVGSGFSEVVRFAADFFLVPLAWLGYGAALLAFAYYGYIFLFRFRGGASLLHARTYWIKRS
ncbi:patatin-like phospholipase family protein [Maritalea mobilis]|uniref:patatin-like phospholipase family protein n=1 Tax=Maritalea mobilis TaxID=483324 RepID=UPI001C968F53|nr:patatin-like phospholipase family protein [Maritalea mobilis]MBY6203173.1 patatin-like phospholipase family protein [Maritalea mobilis]